MWASLKNASTSSTTITVATFLLKNLSILSEPLDLMNKPNRFLTSSPTIPPLNKSISHSSWKSLALVIVSRNHLFNNSTNCSMQEGLVPSDLKILKRLLQALAKTSPPLKLIKWLTSQMPTEMEESAMKNLLLSWPNNSQKYDPLKYLKILETSCWNLTYPIDFLIINGIKSSEQF